MRSWCNSCLSCCLEVQPKCKCINWNNPLLCALHSLILKWKVLSSLPVASSPYNCCHFESVICHWCDDLPRVTMTNEDGCHILRVLRCLIWLSHFIGKNVRWPSLTIPSSIVWKIMYLGILKCQCLFKLWYREISFVKGEPKKLQPLHHKDSIGLTEWKRDNQMGTSTSHFHLVLLEHNSNKTQICIKFLSCYTVNSK